MAKPVTDPVVTLTIASTTAGDLTATFSLRQPIKAVKREAMGRLHLDPAVADSYALIWNGNPLSDDDTLEAAAIPDNATLLLEPRQPEVI